MRVLRAAVANFLLVFTAGFVLGVVREVWIKSMVGARAATDFTRRVCDTPRT